MSETLRKDVLKRSGASTPNMEKTDSVTNLTKPSLYSFYNNSSSSLNRDNEEVEEYIEGSKLHIKAKDANPNVPGPQVRRAKKPASFTSMISFFLTRLPIMAFAAFAYNQVTRNIHLAHVDGDGALINAYLQQFVESWRLYQAFVHKYGLDVFDRVFALSLEGFLLTAFVPALDLIAPTFSKRLVSSNPDPYHRRNMMSDLVRSLITFLGVTYAIRHIEWKSSLQMAMTWSVINPALWLLLDGTINGFVGSAVVAFVASAIIYAQNLTYFAMDKESLITIFLYVGSFFFCGVIIFGKLGRFLFSSHR